MKTMLHTSTPLPHLTTLHMLGRILERMDHSAGPQSRSRYQVAMLHLNRALDRVEQALVVKQILEANPAQTTRLPWLIKGQRTDL